MGEEICGETQARRADTGRIQRQENLELLKALAIVAMVLCHPVIRLGIRHAGYQQAFPFFFGDVILGVYLGVAHAFMFAMGVGITYTHRSAPKQLMGRGLRLFLLGYALNFCRYGVYALVEGIISGAFEAETLEALFGPDILQFAGLALIATGVFKKMKLHAGHLLGIGLFLSAVGAALPFVDMGNYVLNLFAGQFVYTTWDTSCFPFLHWYLFVAAGMLFGAILHAVQNKERFYRRLMLVSGGIMVAYLAATTVFGALFLCRARNYYALSPLEAAGLMSIDLFLLSAFYFGAQRVDAEKLRVFWEMSRNVTPIYCIHWCILGGIDSVCSYLLEITFPWPTIYGIGLVLLVLSFYLARLWKRRKEV